MVSSTSRTRAVLAIAVAVAAGCGSAGTTADPVPRLTQADATSSTVAQAAISTSTPTVESSLAGRVVVLDPGHNGRNFEHLEEINTLVDIGIGTKACNTTGTETDGGTAEAEVNLAVAALVRDALEGAGVQVVMTRTDNDGWGPCIDERARIGNAAAADAVVSIHADGAAADQRGFHVIFPTVVDGLTDDIREESEWLAIELRDALVLGPTTPAEYVGADGLDERGDLGGLLLSDVPAVFVEMGNLRNEADAAILTSSEGQRAIADAIAAGITDYLIREG